MNDPLLVIKDLHVEFPSEYGTVYALRGISLKLQHGEMLGVVGETGCGKSVTGFSALRLVPPPGRITAGQILLEGQNLLNLPEAEMCKIRGNRIAMIFQDPSMSLNPVFSNGRQILNVIDRHLSLNRRQAQERALELLAAVGLPDPDAIFRGYPHQLSGGMQQRVMIAMALAAKPELLIADEPTTALDVTIQAQILDLLLELQRQRGITVLLITHNLGVVAETCSRVVVLYAGQVVEESPVEEFFLHSQHPYSQGLLEALPRLDKFDRSLEPIPGNVPSGLHLTPGCAFAPRCPYVMDKCGGTMPPMNEVSSGHHVACYLEEEGSK